MKSSPSTRVQVFPLPGVVPENLLRWHLFFEEPADVTDLREAARLFDDGGREVVDALLDLPEGLWNDTGTRLTLLLHPGRIKSGLHASNRLGTALGDGRDYRLRIDLACFIGADAGVHEHHFSVRGREERALDPGVWVLTPVRSGTRQPLVLNFGRPLDRLSLEGAVAIVDPTGNVVPGTSWIAADGGSIRFTPAVEWRAGEHRLAVAPDLEDIAGNRLGRAFEANSGETAPKAADRRFIVNTELE